MDAVTLSLIGIAILIVVIIVTMLWRPSIKTNTQSAIDKREQIINDYESRLKKLLKENSDEMLRKKEKIKFLNMANQELSQNIFFTKEEAKEALQKLANM
ncbi:MAG: hypothetical protein U9N42_03635 [Campylobacterota bacterium]|nr:hypothetical protein [Campylobacterota bacterium]